MEFSDLYTPNNPLSAHPEHQRRIQYNLTGFPIELLMYKHRTFCQFFLSRDTRKLMDICVLT